MHYVIVDGSGRSLDSWDDKGSALEAYAALIREEPKASEELAVLACDERGVAVERIDADMRPAPLF